MKAALISAAIASLSLVKPPVQPDLLWQWNAPTNCVPDCYELQIAMRLEQFIEPKSGIYIFTGQIVYTNATVYPIYFSDAPQRFARVRAWIGIEASDWAKCQPPQLLTNN